MTTIYIIGGFLIGIIIGIVIVRFLLKNNTNLEVKELKDSINQMQIQLMEHLANQLNNVRGSVEQSSNLVNREVSLFTQRVTEMKDALTQVHESVNDVKSFEELLKSPKLRGNWGEASLEHLLSEYYPKELYEIQYTFLNGERADAVFKLPNNKLIAIDSKFPLENFSKMTEVSSLEEKQTFAKIFISDVKKRIDEIASKYILPQEGTLDFAIMYVPAEAVYYEMINPASQLIKENLSDYAWKRKIIITSPNLLYLTLVTIEHWFKDIQVSKQTQEILKRFEQIKKDSEKLEESFRKLGSHLSNAQSSYENSQRRLSFMNSKIDKLVSGKIKENDLLEADDLLENENKDSED